MSKKSTQKSIQKLTDIEKGLRYLIREKLREMGIEHTSSTSGPQEDNFVATIAYAQHATSNTRYIGPLFFYYNLEGAVICHRYNLPAQTFNALGTRSGRGGYWPVVRPPSKSHKFDIYDPKFIDHIATFVDEHIPMHHRQPSSHKILLDEIEYENLCFVPDGYEYRNKDYYGIWQRTRIQRLWIWITSVWSFAFYEPERYYLDHALKRHFNVTDEKIKEFHNTVEALKQQRCAVIEDHTETIENENQD